MSGLGLTLKQMEMLEFALKIKTPPYKINQRLKDQVFSHEPTLFENDKFGNSLDK